MWWKSYGRLSKSPTNREMLDKQKCILPEQKRKGKKKWTCKIKWETGLQNEVREEREKPERHVIQSFESQIINDESKLIWFEDHQWTTEREKERETLTSLRLGCLSHSHLHKDHVRRQSVTYLPFQSVTRMQYQQKQKQKRKERKKGERNVLRSEMGKRQWPLLVSKLQYLVQRLRRNQQKKIEEGRRDPDGIQTQTERWIYGLHDLLCLLRLNKCSHNCFQTDVGVEWDNCHISGGKGRMACRADVTEMLEKEH